MHAMKPTARLRPRGKVILRDIAGEHLLIPIRGSLADMQKLFVLEGVGRHVWTQLDGQQTLEEIARSLADEFDVAPDSALRDVTRFVTDLSNADLVEELPRDGSAVS